MSPSAIPIRALCAAPRAHLFTLPRSLARSAITARNLSTTRRSCKDDAPFSFKGSASPPRLPKEDQDIFESLQRQSTGAFSTPRAPPQINQSPDSSASEAADVQRTIGQRAEKLAGEGTSAEQPEKFEDRYNKVIEAKGKGEELHPNVRRGAKPEFEGDINPKTGEVGGPKNEPLRWGAASEWTYNGRATDF